MIRAEGKFNGYIVEYIYDYYEKNGSYPSVSEIKERLNCFRDLIAYRIVISMPRCHMKQKTGSQEGRDQVFISDCQCIATIFGRTWIYGRADRWG